MEILAYCLIPNHYHLILKENTEGGVSEFMKRLAKFGATLGLLAFVMLPAFALMPSSANAGKIDLWGSGAGKSYKGDVETAIGLGNKDIRETIASIINVALGLLGIVAVVIILLGGFKWMTAGGDQGKVDEARKLITAGIVGLAIILSAYAIANFVIKSLLTATGA